MKTRLTIAAIESVKIVDKEVWLSDDDGSRGGGRLVLRAAVAGTKRFYFRSSTRGGRTNKALGYYSRTPQEGFLTLEQARVLVRRLSAAHREGIPHEPSHAVKDAAAIVGSVKSESGKAESPMTLTQLIDLYLSGLKARDAQSYKTLKSLQNKYIEASEWAKIPAANFTSGQAAELLRRIVMAGHVTTSQHVRQLLHAAYEQACQSKFDPMTPSSPQESGVNSNPISNTKSLARLIKPRSRPVLTKRELGNLWNHINQEKFALNVAVRAVRLSILLGGQRCLQLLRCKLSEINLDQMVMTLYDGKGRRSAPRIHNLPMGPLALSEMMALRQIAKDVGCLYLFPGKDFKKPIHSGTVSKTFSKICDYMLSQGQLQEPFRYANIRSTTETGMAGLKVDLHHRAHVQSHGITGVQQKHYDQWAYIDEKSEALLKWEAYVIEAAELATSDVEEPSRASRG